MNFVYLQNNRAANLEKLKDIECNYLKLRKLKDKNGEPLNIEDFTGNFGDFKLKISFTQLRKYDYSQS